MELNVLIISLLCLALVASLNLGVFFEAPMSNTRSSQSNPGILSLINTISHSSDQFAFTLVSDIENLDGLAGQINFLASYVDEPHYLFSDQCSPNSSIKNMCGLDNLAINHRNILLSATILS